MRSSSAIEPTASLAMALPSIALDDIAALPPGTIRQPPPEPPPQPHHEEPEHRPADGQRLLEKAMEFVAHAQGELRVAVESADEQIDAAGNAISGFVDRAEHAIDAERASWVAEAARSGLLAQAGAVTSSAGVAVLEVAAKVVYEGVSGVASLGVGAMRIAHPVYLLADADKAGERAADAAMAVLAIVNVANPVKWANAPQENKQIVAAMAQGATQGFQDDAEAGDWLKFGARVLVTAVGALMGVMKIKGAMKGAKLTGAVNGAKGVATAEEAAAASKAADGAAAVTTPAKRSRITAAERQQAILQEVASAKPDVRQRANAKLAELELERSRRAPLEQNKAGLTHPQQIETKRKLLQVLRSEAAVVREWQWTEDFAPLQGFLEKHAGLIDNSMKTHEMQLRRLIQSDASLEHTSALTRQLQSLEEGIADAQSFFLDERDDVNRIAMQIQIRADRAQSRLFRERLGLPDNVALHAPDGQWIVPDLAPHEVVHNGRRELEFMSRRLLELQGDLKKAQHVLPPESKIDLEQRIARYRQEISERDGHVPGRENSAERRRAEGGNVHREAERIAAERKALQQHMASAPLEKQRRILARIDKLDELASATKWDRAKPRTLADRRAVIGQLEAEVRELDDWWKTEDEPALKQYLHEALNRQSVVLSRTKTRLKQAAEALADELAAHGHDMPYDQRHQMQMQIAQSRELAQAKVSRGVAPPQPRRPAISIGEQREILARHLQGASGRRAGLIEKRLAKLEALERRPEGATTRLSLDARRSQIAELNTDIAQLREWRWSENVPELKAYLDGQIDSLNDDMGRVRRRLLEAQRSSFGPDVLADLRKQATAAEERLALSLKELQEATDEIDRFALEGAVEHDCAQLRGLQRRIGDREPGGAAPALAPHERPTPSKPSTGHQAGGPTSSGPDVLIDNVAAATPAHQVDLMSLRLRLVELRRQLASESFSMSSADRFDLEQRIDLNRYHIAHAPHPLKSAPELRGAFHLDAPPTLLREMPKDKLDIDTLRHDLGLLHERRLLGKVSEADASLQAEIQSVQHALDEHQARLGEALLSLNETADLEPWKQRSLTLRERIDTRRKVRDVEADPRVQGALDLSLYLDMLESCNINRHLYYVSEGMEIGPSLQLEIPRLEAFDWTRLRAAALREKLVASSQAMGEMERSAAESLLAQQVERMPMEMARPWQQRGIRPASTDAVSALANKPSKADFNGSAEQAYMRAISQQPFLSEQQEFDAAFESFLGRKGSGQKLAQHNQPLVVSVAKPFLGGALSLLELVQEGNLGLLSAAEYFDPSRGVRFGAYARPIIKGHIDNAVYGSRLMPMRGRALADMKAISRAESELLADAATGQGMPSVNVESLAKKTDLSVKRIEQVRQRSLRLPSLDAPLKTDGSSASLLELLVGSDTPEGFLNVSREEIESRLATAFNKLTDRERYVLQRKFGMVDDEAQTQAAIADHFGLSTPRIGQIASAALKKLKSMLLDDDVTGSSLL